MLKYLFFSGGFFFLGGNFWMVLFSMIILFYLVMMANVNIFMFNNMFSWMGLDFISLLMISLSIWICFLMILTSIYIFENKFFHKLFILNMNFLLFFLLLTFISMDLFMFYFFFESSILPVLFMVIGWGYQPERIQAGIYLIFYTLFASLPMLMGIFFTYKVFNSMDLFFFLDTNNIIMYFLMVTAFLVKMPMYLVHLWLPKAHVEGPVSSSMILAGVMLKLGGYGLIRFLKLVVLFSVKMSIFWMIISLMGGVYISIMCLHMMDLKLLIAYSSVVHMSLVIGGLVSLNYFGMVGSLMLMVGHGLCSSGLFVLINILYERLGSRSMLINKGLINMFPVLSLWWFLLLSSNMAAPPSLNLFGEISLMMSIISWSKWNLILLMMISFFSASYSIYVFTGSQHGSLLKGVNFMKMINFREILILFLHWVPLNLIIFKMDYFMI
uniref:NADH-ubiquinone oxidoreductase chain 4 n=1 Tax=Hydromanicus wulaianus TaxID=1435189 RepID=A0A342CFI4_9NEOP|nr:NADH dehydrogenase subunit 4 [Hydromanicus wulaianus]AHC32060.1 NADH dehydrogenase subunit 4 [Hydromanicus wulaianus]